MEILLRDARDIKYQHGLSISVVGYTGNPTSVDEDPSQIYLEVDEKGRLKLYVWNGSEDPTVIEFKKKE